jgi:hypothetical protein
LKGALCDAGMEPNFDAHNRYGVALAEIGS